jgi:type IV pilus assembly protein PilV
MLEAMVALLVLALAVLAMLNMQLNTLVQVQTSMRRAQAIRLIEDLSERIRSNPDGIAQLTHYGGGWEAPAGINIDCTVQACAPAELARWDLAQWRDSVAHALPQGTANTFLMPGEVDPARGGPRQLGVMVGWRANERQAHPVRGDAAYLRPFEVSDSAAGVSCPQGLICHLAYVYP